jgi:hypothetical protein
MTIERRPSSEFGKRRPASPQATPPSKRSGHVALLVMGTLAVGSTAYTLMPRERCLPGQPTPPGIAAPTPAQASQPGAATPAPVQANANCSSRSWTSSHGGSSGWRYGAYSSDSSSHSSASSSDASSGQVTRGGFGSFAHAFGFSGHG